MKLSIITINFNHSDDLVKTINSVINQTWNDFEFIIIDGGSTDGSLGEIKNTSEKLAYWVSEKDNGVFHAMNKGIIQSKGEYVLMLNSGDYFSDSEVLERTFAFNNFQEDILYGDVFRAADGKIFTESHFPKKLTFNFFRRGSLSHQAAFIKRTLHETIGLYDENLKFSADWKFFLLAICKFNTSYRHLPFFMAVCDCGGLTCSPENFTSMHLEMNSTLKENFPAFLPDYDLLDNMESKGLKNIVNKHVGNLKTHLKSTLRWSSPNA